MPASPYFSNRDDALTEDPLLGFNFLLELEGAIAGYFTEVSGIGSEHEIGGISPSSEALPRTCRSGSGATRL